MEQFPKIARARMAAHAASEHPEAEQLNAFAENALDARERESVLTHLAACRDCREMVSLAVESRPEGAPLVKPARGGFRWATFQWAAVAASVAIVTVAVLVVGPKENRVAQPATQRMVLRTQTPEPSADPKAPESPMADLKAGRATTSKPDANVKTPAARKEVAGGLVSGGGNGVAITDGGFGGIGVYKKNEVQKPADTDAVAKLQEKKEAGTAQPTKAAPSRELAYSAPALNANDTFYSSVPASRPAQGSVQGGIAQNAPPPPPSPATDGERARAEEQAKSTNQISKDKRRDAAAPASTESVEVSSQPAAQAPTVAAKFSKQPAPAERRAGGSPGALIAFSDAGARAWRLNSWRVESSDDAGRTWQDRTPAKNFQVSTIAVGQQVWAGGKAGALFLSRDNGQTWTKISLTGDDIIPLGDVTAIKIANPLLVDVILSSGDDWQTNDGGKSFRLLPRKP